MPRRRKARAESPATPQRLSQTKTPIHIDRDAIYSAAALRAVLHLPSNTLATLKRDGRLRASRVSNTDVYLGSEVLDCVRRCAETDQAETPDSSAA
jgi:hypothetical protein